MSNNILNNDEMFLQRAIDLATESVAQQGGPFGAVVALDGRIVGEGSNRVVEKNDPTAHAEIEALRAAGASLGRFHLTGCVLYASSEPCPMCLAAANWARVDRIVFANPRAVAAAAGFCDDDLFAQLALPPSERNLPSTRIALPGADEPIRLWRAMDQRVPY